MGTKLVGPCVKEDSMEMSSIPPGFESLAPFTMQKAEDNQFSSYSSSASAVDSPPFMLETKSDLRTSKPLRRKRGMKCNQLDISSASGDEYESDQPTVSRDKLPKGLVRGCEACDNCQKVIAKWNPEEMRRPDLEAAPVFYPSEEEFEDTLKYISSIRAKAEVYGICRIVPPPSWKPPSPLKEKNIWESSKFVTRVQRIDKLQNRDSMKKTLQASPNKKRRKRRCMKNGIDSQNSNEEAEIRGEVGIYEAERFGFEPGPEFTLDAYQKYADYFKNQYFMKNNGNLDSGCDHDMPEQWQPSLEEIEGEYWRMVEKPTEEIEVLYGADIETGIFGSGFPKNSGQVHSASEIKYINSGWNLNNFPRLPGSVLSFESSDISGVLVPWLYVGMCFSSFCWHVEDHHLYSLNYMHWGAPKMWYGVPGSDAVKLEAAMRKHLPDLFEEQPDLLHKLVTQLSPSLLKSEGVRVFRCVQNPGEFVLTFPRAYHAGFNSGFNCAEAVNVAPVDWLPHGQNAIELYREQCRKTSISHDKLLLGAAREAVKANWEYNLLRKFTSENLKWKGVCGRDGLLSKALKSRVEMERARRDILCKSSQALKMESSFDANSERECSVCLFDLHLSAAGCHRCSPDKYACLNHANQLCSCSWGAKFYLFRYDINELNILVEALEGKLSAVYRWARLDLGLALSSYVSKDNKQVPGVQNKLPYTSQGPAQKEASSVATATLVKTQKDQAEGKNSSAKHVGSTNSSQRLGTPIVVLALENAKASANLSAQKTERAKHKTPCQNENPSVLDPLSVTSCQLSQVDGLKVDAKQNLASKRSEGSPLSSPGKNYVILLSDDDEEETDKGPSSVGKEASGNHTGNFRKPLCSENMVVGMGGHPENPSMAACITGQPVLPVTNGSDPVHIKVEDDAEAERNVGVNPVNQSYSETFADSTCSSSQKNESPCSADASGDADNKPQHIDEEKIYEGDGHKNVELDADSRTMHNAQSVSCSPSAPQNISDRYYRQKGGPRIAKVVRRINCNIEPLDFGAVCAGKLWCDSRAIYPKGFRSRVRYIDVVDPSNTCNYISEILDVGRDGPLFMVYVEHTPGEVFVHVSAARCWEMVRERVNQEVTKQHKLGRPNLPPLQPPGSTDGMEMFGFSSPAIVQVIQAMDQSRVCSEYWKSRPLMQIPQQSDCGDSKNDAAVKPETPSDEGSCKRHPGVEKILSSLFKKANSDELHTLYSLLYKKNSSDDLSLLTRLLNEEIDKNTR